MSIRINWVEVEATKTRLLHNGATNSFEMMIIVLYYSKSTCDKIQIKLGQLEAFLYDLGSDQNVKGIFLYDVEMKQPYLKCEEPNRVNILESVPNSGHPNILLEFNKMTTEARDVWTEIAFAELQHYVCQEA